MKTDTACTVVTQRERAAWLKPDSVDPLHSEIAERLLERFQVRGARMPRLTSPRRRVVTPLCPLSRT